MGGVMTTAGGRDAGGFTLIEMMVVLVVMGLLLALVFPHLGGSHRSLAAAAHDIGAELRLVRDEAIYRGRPTRFFARATEFGSSEDRRPHHVPPGMMLTVSIDRAGSAGSSGGIRFFPDGSSSGGRVVVTSGREALSVSVNWIDGDVSIAAEPPAARN